MVFNLGIATTSKSGRQDVDQDTIGSGTGTQLQRTVGQTQTASQVTSQQNANTQQNANEFLLTLPPEVQAAVAGVIQQLSGGAGAPGVTPETEAAAGTGLEFATALANRSLGVSEDFSANIQPILAKAEASNQRRLEEISNTLATQAGSGLNTLAQLGIQESGIQLDTELAALEGGLNLQGANLEEQAITNAIGALTQAPQVAAGVTAAGRGPTNEASANIANLVNSLKGGTQVGQRSSSEIQQITSQQTQLQQQLQDILTAFASFQNQFQNVTGTTKTREKGTSTNAGINL